MRALLIVAALAALATPVNAETMTAPDGSVLNIAKCKSNARDCLNEAGRTCSGPYQVIDSESHAGGLLADAIAGPVTWFSMIFRCGQSDGALPAFQFRGPSYRPPSHAQCTVSGNSIFCFGS